MSLEPCPQLEVAQLGGGLDFPKYYSKFPCAEREEKFPEIYIVWEGSRAGS